MDGETDARVETSVTADRTVVDYHGPGDAAVVVRSAGGERIYLPLVDEGSEPTDRTTPYDGGPGTTPYDGAGTAADVSEASGTTTPYGGSGATSPYGGETGPEPGLRATASGFRVVHPEPATDVRVLR